MGYILWQPGERARLETCEVLGVPLALLRLGRGGFWERRRARRLVLDLRRRGVRQVACPEFFPGEELISAAGLRRASPAALRRALMEPLFAAVCRESGLTVPLDAARLSTGAADPAAWEAAKLLSRRARYVEVRTAGGGEALRRRLYRELGVTSGRGPRSPAVQICLDESRDDIPSLHLGRGCAAQRVWYEPSPTLCQALAPWPAEEGLLSLLYSAGALPTEELRVRSVEPHA